MAFTGYNKAYLEEYRNEARTPLGQAILQHRVEIVGQFCPKTTLLDYGCGTGVFVDAARQAGYEAVGWDINPDSPYAGPEPTGHYDILTLWDVIEHLPAPHSPLLAHTPQWVCLCTPNAQVCRLPDFRDWKHFKPKEHLHYYTPITMAMTLASVGYTAAYLGYMEGALRNPRAPWDVFTMVFEREKT